MKFSSNISVLPQRFKVFFAVASCSFLITASGQAKEPVSSVKINYFSNTQSIQVNLNHFTAAKKASATLESVDIPSTYRSGNAFILDMPKGVSPETLSSLNASFKKTAGIEIMENATAVLITYPPGNDALTNSVMDIYSAQAAVSGESRAQLKKGYLLKARLPDGGEVEAVSDRETIPSGDWFRTLVLNNRLNVKGGRVTGQAFGKLFGGSGVLYDMAKRGYMADADINIAWLSSLVSNMSAEEVLGLLRETKADIYPFSPYDLPMLNSLGSDIAKENRGKPEFICSNIKLSTSALGGLWKKHAVREVNGIKVGFFYLIDNKTLPDILGPLQAELADPVETAREIAKTLIEKEKVDTVIMLTAFFPEDLRAILPKMPVVDIVINNMRDNYFSVTRKERIELENWGEEKVDPALVSYNLPHGKIGKIQLDFSGENGEKRLVSISRDFANLPFNDRKRNKYDDQEDAGFLLNLSSGPEVLPDPAKLLSENNQSYTPVEIYNLAAAILNERSKTEVTLLNLNPFKLNTVGQASEETLRRWLQHKKVFAADLSGSGLRSLLKQIDFELPAGSYDPWEKYHKGDRLAAAGLTKDGRIGGMNVEGNEVYRISVTEDLLAKKNTFPALNGLKNITDTGLYIDDVVINELVRMKESRGNGVKGGGKIAKTDATGEYYARLRRLISGTPELRWRWRLNVRDISLQFSETQVSNTEAFSQVPNSKLQASDQLFLQGSVKLALEARRDSFWNDTKMSLDYGKVTLRPVGMGKVESETADQVLFENEVRYAALKFDRFGGAVAGPLASLGYNTEFTSEQGIPKRRIAIAKAGLKVFEGRVIQDFYTAAVMERDFTFPDAYTKWAWETGAHIGGLIGASGPGYSVDVSYKQFSPSRLRVSDLKRELDLTGKLSIRLLSDLNLMPFASFYTAKSAATGAIAQNLMFGISLGYSRLFKLKN